MKTIETRGLSLTSLFKLLFIGNLFSVGLACLVYGLFSFFGWEVFHINQVPVSGIRGLFAWIVMAPLASLILAGSGTVSLGIGCWLYTRCRNLTLRYREVPPA